VSSSLGADLAGSEGTTGGGRPLRPGRSAPAAPLRPAAGPGLPV